MNRLNKISLLMFLVALFIAPKMNGQGFNSKNKYWSIGATVNAMNYVGELDPGPSFLSPGIKFTRYNFGAVVMRRISPRISWRGAFSFGRISGDDFENSTYNRSGKNPDVFRKARNLSFFNNVYELKADIVIDLIEHRGRYQKRPDFVPYLFVGLAYFHHNPKAKMNGKTFNLHDMSTEGQGTGIDGAAKPYSLNQIALPIGLGLRYKLAKQWDLAFEIGWRFTTTDYLDDVGGNYVDKAQLLSKKGADAALLSDRTPEVVDDPNFVGFKGTYIDDLGRTSFNGYGQSGNQRGDKKGRKDAYIITGFHLLYIIPTKVICPKFR